MIDISGIPELQRDLAKMQDPALRKALQKGVTAAAKFLKPRVQAAAPRRTGTLRKSVSARQGKRNRPSAVVTARAWYRHFVIDGTKAHRIRFPNQKAAGVAKSAGNIRHPGARANPFIDRAASSYDHAAVAVATAVIEKELP